MKRIVGPVPENMLSDIHFRLTMLPTLFKQKVGEECSWSLPTFYRKLRQSATISNAEREKIMDVFDLVFTEALEHCGKYRRPKR
jgi:hypothetical protein